ncbi:uncharacterized protein LOC144642164 [Oculina patagonica]
MSSGNEQLIDQFKEIRTSAEAHVSEKVNKLNELMAACENIDALKDVQKELKEVLKEFEIAHEAYHRLIKNETEQEESTRYYNSVLEIVTELEKEISSWITGPPSALADRSNDNVRPEDSISSVESRPPYRTRSEASLSRSSASSKARSAARKAALEARAATLQSLHQIQLEELKLQQKKAEVELQAEIAEIEAERKVYEEEEASKAGRSSLRRRENKPLDQSNQLFQQTKDASKPPERDTINLPDLEASRNKPIKSTPKPLEGNSEYPIVPETPEWRHGTSAVGKDDSLQFLMEAQDRQSHALQRLLEQQQQGVMSLTLPQPDMQVFSGDPIDYCDFVRSFEHLVEGKTFSSSSRLYYLVQYTSGPVKELMKSCLTMREQEGYVEARRLLKERYGQGYKIAAAHVKRLVEGPQIKAEDGTALERFSIQLTSCVNTLTDIGYLNKLDNPDNLKKVIERLPYGFRLKWRDTVDRIVEREQRDVTIKDIMDFVVAKARAATHPIFGNVTNERNFKPPTIQPPRKSRNRGNGFSTQGKTQSPQPSDKGPTCTMCTGKHWLPRCERFRKKSLQERQSFVDEKKLCSNCLNPGHFIRDCPKESFCRVQGCTGKHSTFLHPRSSTGTSTASAATERPNAEQDTSVESPPINVNSASNGYIKSSYSTASTSVTGLAIVPVRVKAKGQRRVVETYAFLDSGSNTSFCTETLLEKLNFKGTRTKLSLTTLQGESEPIECSLVSLEASDLNESNKVQLPMVYSRSSLPIPSEAIAKQEDVDRWPYLKGVQIAHIDAEIGLLIGSDVPEALQPKEMRPSENGGPFATLTVLGWVLNGPLGRSTTTKVSTVNFLQGTKTLDEQFHDFCNQEFNDSSYESKTSMSLNDRKALNIMEETVQLQNGHYEMALPWKFYPPRLQNNRTLAERRLLQLKRRLLKEPLVHQKYKAFMDDLLSKDYARKVNCQYPGPLGTHWYLPHHPVFSPQKPDKVRVVFDCSAKYCNTSLNDQLLQGPDLTNSLVGVLSRFREDHVALMSDVEAMFHQVRVRPSDCDALRFLWWPDGNLDNQPEEYQMMVHLFGGASSPSCANFALKRTAEDNKEGFEPQTIETVKRNFYVDDCLKSVESEDKAIRLAKELRELLAKGGFKLTKWLSNSRKVIESLPESERAAQVKTLDFDKLPVERALGVQWNVASDQFGFSIVIKDRPATRRGILSIVSSVYDPLGFAAPFILNAKLILQDLCRNKYGWDDKIPDEYLQRWQAWLQELPKLEQLTIQRCFKSPDLGEIASCQLHHFSDASQQAYGAVTYLRITDHDGNVNSSFVMGKSRLAPIKPVTIPRMELSAAVVATRLEKISRGELSLPINQSFFWTDSTCVLRYLENQDRRFQTFVANRVATIHDASSPSQWRYVNTQFNPADDASRGVSADSLQRWIHGPEFLTQTEETWPQRPGDMNTTIAEDDPEVKKESVTYASEASAQDPISEIIERFSSWTQLKRIVAWILRYKSNLSRLSKKRRTGESVKITSSSTIVPITTEELNQAEVEILKHVQSRCFKEEHDCLREIDQQATSSRQNMVKKTSNIFKLDPILSQGLIRVGGRLQLAPINSDAMHPVVLPKKHHVVKLIIQYYHHISGHSGLEYTLSLTRQKYWIINGRSTVRNILNECFSCRKRQAPLAQQKMANLPEDRITPSKPPFTYTGVDCFGPFEVRRGRAKVKRYGVIFTCLALRAVHIEVVWSLDTESFIQALRRFISRKGQPEEIRSDNGGNFVKGERELREAVNEWNQSQIHDYLLQRNIKWKFNPPAGSHHGGVWERCIRTVRKVMKALMKEQVLDDKGLETLMCEVEAIINGRPITKLSDDPRDAEPLTPNHLLLLRTGPKVPPGNFTKHDNYFHRRWRQVQYLADVFWKRWVREYLPSLQQRQKWHKQQRNFAVDDVVLVLEDSKPRNSWPLARIQEVFTNRRDGLVRSVKLKTSTSELVRPIDKIVLLEAAAISANEETNEH